MENQQMWQSSTTLIPERYRLNLSQTAKGLWQIDTTIETDSIEKTCSQMNVFIKEIKKIMEENNLTEAK